MQTYMWSIFPRITPVQYALVQFDRAAIQFVALAFAPVS